MKTKTTTLTQAAKSFGSTYGLVTEAVEALIEKGLNRKEILSNAKRAATSAKLLPKARRLFLQAVYMVLQRKGKKAKAKKTALWKKVLNFIQSKARGQKRQLAIVDAVRAAIVAE